MAGRAFEIQHNRNYGARTRLENPQSHLEARHLFCQWERLQASQNYSSKQVIQSDLEKSLENQFFFRFSRIYPDGRVTYSQRLTIGAACKMSLRKYPLDSQFCPLFIGSYGYTSEDLVYKWKENVSTEEL